MSTKRYLDPDKSQEKRRARTQAAIVEFRTARTLAAMAGMELTMHNHGQQFNLRRLAHPQWLKQLYPSNQRIYAPPASSSPFLKMPETRPWTLTDVVQAAIEMAKS